MRHLQEFAARKEELATPQLQERVTRQLQSLRRDPARGRGACLWAWSYKEYGLRPMTKILHASITFSLRRRASATSSSLSAPGLIQISAICFFSNPSSSVMPISGGTYTVAMSMFPGTSVTEEYVATPSTDDSFGLIGMTLWPSCWNARNALLPNLRRSLDAPITATVIARLWHHDPRRAAERQRSRRVGRWRNRCPLFRLLCLGAIRPARPAAGLLHHGHDLVRDARNRSR